MCKEIKKFIQCRNCPNKDKGGPQIGYYYDTLNNLPVIRECSCHKKWKEEIRLITTMEESKIKPDYSFEDYKGTSSLVDLNCLKKIASNPDKFIYKKMIYVWGPNGTQKTSMCQALGKELILKGYSVQYEMMSDLISNLVNDFTETLEQKENREYRVQRCMSCDFLILDESFDLKKSLIYSSGYQIPYIDNFIRNRFEIGKKSIIFISNKAPNEISEVPPTEPGKSVKEGFGMNLQSLIERNVKQSTLIFKDVWIQNANCVDRFELFK